MTDASVILKLASDLADDFLFPRATATDASDILPAENLDALAEAGFYGLFVPEEMGGLGADFTTICRAVEMIAGGCLTTAFVWVQHFGLLGSLFGAPDELRDAWLPQACLGQRRGGIAFGGRLPGPPALTASPHRDGWVIHGFAPFVSGWERIDILHVAARGPDDTVVNVALDARAGDGVSVRRLPLAAVNASSTVRLEFESVVVGDDRLLGIEPYAPAEETKGPGLRVNGSLALGLARRCCDLIGPSPLDEELALRRAALDQAEAEQLMTERARVSAFAMRAASALVVHTGSKSIATDQPAQRLAREAIFLLVFGSRAPIKEALLASLTAGRPAE